MGGRDHIYVRLYNNGPLDAYQVKVNFGFYPFTAGIAKFYEIGAEIVDVIPKNKDKVLDISWNPPELGLNEYHGCIVVTIDYGIDTDFSNGSNFARKIIR